MKLAAYGDRVWFELVDGSHVYASSPRDAVLYDAEGVYWPRTSVLVGPFQRGRRRVELEEDARRYFGRGYDLREGRVMLPPRSLATWRRLASPVRRAFYVRAGLGGDAPAGAKHHPFNSSMFGGLRARPVLYARGRFLRLELGRGARGLGARGFLD